MPKQKEPIPGLQFAEVMYADDTPIFGTHAQTINELLHEIQVESQQYNLQLNLDKSVNLTINQRQSSVFFLTVRMYLRKMQTVHLGATLTEAFDNRREILKKVGEANSIANRLKVFWSKARTTKRWKLRVLNSVIFGKLLYGLETIQPTRAEQDRIDAFQMKMLRRVLQVPPTHVDREWTNQRVIEHTRRVGKPRASWLIETCKEAFPISNPHTGFDINSSDQMRHLADWATHRQAPCGVNQ